MSRRLVSRAAAPTSPAPVAIVAAALFLVSVSPATPAEQAPLAVFPVHQCVGSICMNLQELPGGKRLAFFSNQNDQAFTDAVHLNVRDARGNQIEICGSCSWSFFAKPGKSYTFSVQSCTIDRLSSDCHPWNVFHYVAPQTVEAPAGPTKKLGRVEGQSLAAPLPICESARKARARNSPAAPGLEAQCKAAMSQQVTAVTGTGEGPDGHVLKDKAGGKGADLMLVSLNGPGSLQAGLSGTYKITVKNSGDAGANVELTILFAKALNQTGQIVPSAGLACAPVGHSAAINAQINCTGGQLGAGETGTVIVQGRGQVAGAGTLVGTLNNSRLVQESSYDNNVKQLNVTIN